MRHMGIVNDIVGNSLLHMVYLVNSILFTSLFSSILVVLVFVPVVVVIVLVAAVAA